MGYSFEYPHVHPWKPRKDPYLEGDFTIYKGSVFRAAFWVSGETPPAQGDPNTNSWRLYDELYDVTTKNTTKVGKVIAYLPTWRRSENFDYARHEIYANITHCIIAFLMFNETKLGTFTETSLNDVEAILPDVLDTARTYRVKILIALGGATDYGFLYLLTKIGETSGGALLQHSVDRVKNFVNKHKLDGVDLDLECWWDKDGNPVRDQGGRLTTEPTHVAGRGLSIFAKALRDAMPDKLLSAAFFATSWYGNNYPLVDTLDWIGVMTYDLTGSWNNSPVGPPSALYKIRDQEKFAREQHGSWPQANPANASEHPMRDNPILSVEDSLWYWTNPHFLSWQGEGQKLDRSKLAIGVPIYGYDFASGKDVRDPVSNKFPPGYKTLRYTDILDQFPSAYQTENGNIKVSGSKASPQFAGGGTYPWRTNLYFDTPAMAAEKMKFAKRLGLQGVIIWELSNDSWENNKSIIKRLYLQSGNPRRKPIKFLAVSLETENGPKLKPEISEFSQGWLGDYYDSCFAYKVDGQHFWYGQSSYTRRWSIRRLYAGGSMGDLTASGTWKFFYRTMFSYEIGGRTFFYGQNIDNGSNWFLQELLAGGEMGEETAHGTWKFQYAVNVVFTSGGKTYFFGHRKDDKYWFIQELQPGGLMGEEITNGNKDGFLDTFYSSAFSFSDSGRQFLYAQQGYESPCKWIIRELGGRKLWGDETQSGSWTFNYDVNVPLRLGENNYFFGYRQGYNWFIQELKEGEMGPKTDNGNWHRSYVGICPFNIDGKQYIFRTEYNNYKYDIHEVQFPDDDLRWYSETGDYGFQLHKLDSESVNREYVHTTKRIQIAELVPYFVIILAESDEHGDLPAGAYLRVEEPSEPGSRHISIGVDLGDQGVLYEEPQLGTYEVTLTVPKGRDFQLTICALPYRDPSQIGRRLVRRSSGGSQPPNQNHIAVLAAFLLAYALNPNVQITTQPLNYVTNSNPRLPNANAVARRNTSPYIDPNLPRLVSPDIRQPPSGTAPIPVGGQAGPIIEYVSRPEIIPAGSASQQSGRPPYDVTVWLHARIDRSHLRVGARARGVPRNAQERARLLGEPTDDAGHIVADRFNVPPGFLQNYFPQNPNFNSHRYVREVEDVLWDAVEAAGNIEVWFQFNYDDPSFPNRPTTFFVFWVYPNGSISSAYFYNPLNDP